MGQQQQSTPFVELKSQTDGDDQLATGQSDYHENVTNTSNQVARSCRTHTVFNNVETLNMLDYNQV